MPTPTAPDETTVADGTAPRPTRDAADLDTLEQRAAADPDDLRAGAEYRKACVAAETYDRCLDFFAQLAAEHPESYAAHMNWGYAFVDKIPAAGAVTQVILADKALRRFSEAIDIDETWLALYTRGNSYVYWPAIFGRTQLGIADLDKAVELSASLGDTAPAYHAHAYAALGDGYWRLGDLESAHDWWRKGLRRFPDDAGLAERLMLEGKELDAYLDAHYAIGARVDTSLDELWQAAGEATADGTEDEPAMGSPAEGTAPSEPAATGDGAPGDAGR